MQIGTWKMERFLKKLLPGGRFRNVTAKRSAAMAAVKGKHNSSTERAFAMALVRAGIQDWRMQAKLTGRPDVYFDHQRLAVFLDGCFWHGCPRCGHFPKTNSKFWCAKIKRNKARDLKNNEILRRAGISVVRLWECSLKNETVRKKTIEKIRQWVNVD